MLTVTISVFAYHRLDHEEDYRTKGKTGIQWTLWTQLEDLDFADDIALLSHTQQQMQAKKDRMAEVAGSVGLRINK